MSVLRWVLLTGLAAAPSAFAQDSDTETAEVSASRISLPGFEAPTPVTSISAENIARDARADLGDLIRQQPSMGASPSLNNGGNATDISQGDAGIDTVNLRNLGVNRTLVLFDGQRVVSSNLLGGGVDLTTLPTALVKRVDIVTGGASAAWGSDAVAGVVNLVLDRQFQGFKASATLGDTTDVNQRKMALEGAWGSDLADGRAHLELGGNYTTSPDAVMLGQAGWWRGTSLVRNPAYAAGQPLFIHQDHVGSVQVTQGGLIAANSAGGAGSSLGANGLAGLQFGPGGAVSAFDPGTVFGNNCYNGCTNNERTGVLRFTPLAVPYHHGAVFAYGSYQLAPDITASVQLNYGLSGERNIGGVKQAAVTIRPDNAYLDPSVAARFGTLSNGFNAGTGAFGTAAVPSQALLVATENLNNMPADSYKLRDLCQTVGAPCDINDRALMRGVFTLAGKLNSDWSWNAYVQHGGVREVQRAYNDVLAPRYNFAVDAVRVTPSNVGASGLPVGSIQCRALLQGNAAAAGCVPLNILGTDTASPAALLYVNPGRDPNSGILDRELITLNQDVVSGSMQGVLPWALPAGPVALAFGAEYRHEQGGVIQANALGAAGQWAAGNFVPYRGQYHVEEGFLEVDAPLLRDTIVQSLDVNAAGRLTSYSTSGLVETWKLGLTSQLDQNIRLRGTWSLDIRAPQISELFSPGTLSAQYCSYPLNAPAYQCFAQQGGNINLQPEKAVTVSGGIVVTPATLPGLTLSADWYAIDVHGEINTVDYQTIINRCLLGEQVYCPQLVFAGGAAQPTQVNVFPLNSDRDSTSGLDVAAHYVHPLWDGAMTWELTGNYTDQQTRTALGITYDRAGALGASPDSYASGIPKLRALVAATYQQGPWSLTAQARVIGAARLTNGPEGVTAIHSAAPGSGGATVLGDIMGLVDDNDIGAVGYFDLRGSYDWTPNLQVYGAVDNVTDVAPPAIASTSGGTGTNAMVYDALGRAIRVGVRIAG